jgi:hypothetical protein
LPRATIDKAGLNHDAILPFELRLSDIENAMQDVYDFFHDVNIMLLAKGLQRLDDMTRPAALSGMISDMITGSLARFSRSLVSNTHFNGHPDLVVRGRYPNNAVLAGVDGVEIKSTRKEGGAVDTHGAPKFIWGKSLRMISGKIAATPKREPAPRLCTKRASLNVAGVGFIRPRVWRRRNELGEPLNARLQELRPVKQNLKSLRKNKSFNPPLSLKQKVVE